MNLLKLRLSMFGTLAIIIALSTIDFAIILGFMGFLNIYTLALFVVPFNLVQWLFAPQLINFMYRVKGVKREDSPKLYGMIERLAVKSGIKKPKIGIMNIRLPNAFAYSSPIAGNHVAVTRGLLDTLEEEEVEAVVAHEFGHFKHRDVQIMMFVSFIPALFYFLYQYAIMSAYIGGKDRKEAGGGMILIGIASLLMYFVVTFFTLGLSRLREYYADSYSASIVEDGSRKLSEGLAKIIRETSRMRRSHQREAVAFNSFKALFISDPDRAESEAAQIAYSTTDQELVEKVLSKKLTSTDRVMELFSTHPNTVKRLRALKP